MSSRGFALYDPDEAYEDLREQQAMEARQAQDWRHDDPRFHFDREQGFFVKSPEVYISASEACDLNSRAGNWRRIWKPERFEEMCPFRIEPFWSEGQRQKIQNYKIEQRGGLCRCGRGVKLDGRRCEACLVQAE